MIEESVRQAFSRLRPSDGDINGPNGILMNKTSTARLSLGFDFFGILRRALVLGEVLTVFLPFGRQLRLPLVESVVVIAPLLSRT